MRITTCGASGGEVTGSCYLIETPKARVLLDCGMFQGHGSQDDAKNADLGPVEPASLDAVVLTHAHLDHCGRFPLLAQRGLKCPIFATPATVDFATLVIEDSSRIQEADTARENKYRRIDGKELLSPLYTTDDARKLIPLVRAVEYDTWADIAPGISMRFVDAGHILGSASVEMKVQDGGHTRHIWFSADVGRWDTPFLKNPTLPGGSPDLVFLESTYGDRDHRSQEATVSEFRQILHDAVWARQKILIPAFAIGRTQQILFHIAELVRGGTLPEFPIFLDSPMAIKATELYKKHQDLFDAQATALAKSHQLSRDLRNLQYTESVQDSIALNEREGCAVIIAGSGMCDGGRIVHHLRHNLWRRGVSVIMVGYAAQGSLGRALVDGAPEVQIHHKTIPVRASVHTLGGFSAHAGQSELLKWLAPVTDSKPRVCLTHGENPQRQILASKIQEQFQITASLPQQFEAIEL